MSETWQPKILCAAAVDRQRIAFAVSDLEYDEAFSAVLIYDATATEPDPQPWGRIDIPREVTAICPFDPTGASDRAEYAILSNEGDVYYTAAPLGQLDPEKIPGAGLLSPDADGRGALYGLAVVDGKLHACGTGGQVHARDADGTWRDLSPDLPPEGGLDAPAFAHLVPLSAAGFAAVGGRQAQSGSADFAADPGFKADMTPDEFMALFEKYNGSGAAKPAQPVLALWSGGAWSTPSLAAEGSITDAGLDAAGALLAVTDGGALLKGTPDTGFSNALGPTDREVYTAVDARGAATGGAPLLASLHALHRFDGYLLRPIKPVVRAGQQPLGLNPIALESVEGGVFYVDANGFILFFDGADWTPLDIPSRLLARSFEPSR
ncbi:MAG: hypothetical protein AAF968_05660 [Pseudomonadota bacterium]